MAQRQPGSRRAKGSQDPDDVFVAKVLHAGKWAESNQQLITILIVIVAIAFAGLLYYRSYRGSLDQQAAQQLELVYQSVAIQDTEGAVGQLVTFLERFGGTAYAGEARLLLGDLYLRSDRAEQALAVLEPIGASPSSPIDLQAASLLAAAYEQVGRGEEAEATYMRIVDRSDMDFQVRNALAAAARIRGDRGDAAGAIELYERALDSLDAEDPQRGLYEMRIAEIRAATNT
jgi:predicted negative regulator of RcsB-dependent stress response